MKRWTGWLLVLVLLCSLTLTANAAMPILTGKPTQDNLEKWQPLFPGRENDAQALPNEDELAAIRQIYKQNNVSTILDHAQTDLLDQDLLYLSDKTMNQENLTGKNALLDGCGDVEIRQAKLSNMFVSGATNLTLGSGQIQRLYVISDEDIQIDIGAQMHIDELILLTSGKFEMQGQGNVDTTIAMGTPEDLTLNLGTNLLNLTGGTMQFKTLDGEKQLANGENMLIADHNERTADTTLTVTFRLIDQSAREMGIEAAAWDGALLTDVDVTYTGVQAGNCPVAEVNVAQLVANKMQELYPEYSYTLVPGRQSAEDLAYRTEDGKPVLLSMRGVFMTPEGNVIFPIAGGKAEAEFLVYVYRYERQDGRITYRLRIGDADPAYFTPSLTLDSGAVATFTYDVLRREWVTQLQRSDFGAGERAAIQLTGQRGEKIGAGLIVTGREENRIVTLSWTANTQRVTIDAQDTLWESTMPTDGNALLAKAGEQVTLTARAADGFRGVQVSLSDPTVDITMAADGTVSFLMPYAPLTLTMRSEKLHTLEYRLNRTEGDVYFRALYTAKEATIEPDAPVLAGYTFAGWYLNADGNGNPFVFGNSITKDTTLYACWQPTEYTVTLDANGGDPIRAISYTIETPTFSLPTPVRLGYAFDGWTGENLPEAQLEVSIARGSMGDKTYTAAWGVIRYTVTLDTSGGDPLDALAYTVEDSVTLPTPTRADYTFLGWLGAGETTPQATVVLPVGTVGDKVYTAQWKAEAYTVTLDTSGGDPLDAITYTMEDSVTLPTPTRAGYEFLGWTGEGINTPTKDVTIPKGSTGDQTYTAQWEIIPYTITCILTPEGKEMQTIPYDVTQTLTLEDPEMEGYTFLGWTGEGITTPTKGVTMPVGSTGDRTYTANWAPAT